MEMRRSDRLMEEGEAKALLEKCEYGILSTFGEDGYPYGVPVSYAYDKESNKIYFHCAASVGHKCANINHLDKVCFTVVGDTEVLPAKFSTKYESVVAFGTAKAVEDKIPGLMKLVAKYSPDFMEAGQKYADSDHMKTSLYEIEVERLTGKARR